MKYETYCSRNRIKFSLTQPKFNERMEEAGCIKAIKVIDGEQAKVWLGVDVEKSKKMKFKKKVHK
ncbi:hypothetical protein ES703_60592 [subsurface metagenome]